MKTTFVLLAALFTADLSLAQAGPEFECPNTITITFSEIEAAPVDQAMRHYPDLLTARNGVAALSTLTSRLTRFGSESDGPWAKDVCFYHDDMVPLDLKNRVHYLRPFRSSASKTGAMTNANSILSTWFVTPSGTRFGIGFYLEFSRDGMRATETTPAGRQFPQLLQTATLQDPHCEPIPVGNVQIPCPVIWSESGRVNQVSFSLQ